MVAKLDTSAEVRKELECVYWNMKQNIIPMAHGKELTTVLKTLAGVIHQEKQIEVDEQIAELRAAIDGLRNNQRDDEELN